MEKSFRSGPLQSYEREALIKRGKSKDVVISRNGKDPKVLVWRDHFSNDQSSDVDGKLTPELKVFKFDGDSLKKFYHDFQVFNFNGDSRISIPFDTDSLLKRFDFRVDGMDSNLRRRIFTMHRDIVPGKPGVMTFRRNGPGIFLNAECPDIREDKTTPRRLTTIILTRMVFRVI